MKMETPDTKDATIEDAIEPVEDTQVVSKTHVDQLTVVTMAMYAAQLYLKAMHPTERRRFLKDPQKLLGVVFYEVARSLTYSDEGARALIAEMKRIGF